ncbi:D-alanyl-D-alanine carboxypeptidase/D-alanyl-D-alanine endopeptidase [Conexibacter arvalis]|uniref:D-alanyl-D-alanine carboxypeptidase/D-alanyl-D-alanine-endopeptidase (Penicillin-binding protein 4) n=1 Tax=Conexibacter arvalis TaxID=912552 RepID=A0A840IDM6_9ACTN|nr:D-alanyl-D-alanine carboxypeptidase/D-alanyl-D-alanine-endopeptidase [Conexibacter arvalis]MBB4662896.1 D-alanyl-D-alanine carboxypeptidase/D-alanyl-D-alanine-endopeptidase (penicillin-binding protein 4) [Conexibacter arvalis]
MPVPSSVRRIALLLSAAALTAPAAVAQTASAAPLDRAVTRELSRAGGVNGGYVLDTTTGRVLASVRADTPRIPASVEKLYTTSTALLRFGADGTLDTSVLGSGRLLDNGTWRGDLWLRGTGDPTFGSQSFINRSYGVGTSVEELAQAIADAGITRVTGRVYGDESRFDLRRGGPSTSWRYDVWIGGALSALLYNRGLAKEDGSARQTAPALFAAQQLTAALKRAGVRVGKAASSGPAPESAEQLAAISSPPMSTLARLTNVDSDNLYAEQLLKTVGAHHGRAGSTAAGAAVVRQTMRRFKASPRIADGSGLSRVNATTPRQVVLMLDGMRDEPGFRASLPVAGRTGTLAKRMRGTSAQDRCQAKTGTLSNVSALAGYCRTANNHVVAFAFLANSVYTVSAKAAEDRLAIMLARQRPAGAARADAKAKAQKNRSGGAATGAAAHARRVGAVRVAR